MRRRAIASDTITGCSSKIVSQSTFLWRTIGSDSLNPDDNDVDPIENFGYDGKESSSSETIFSHVVSLFYLYDRDMFALMAEAGGTWSLSSDVFPA